MDFQIGILRLGSQLREMRKSRGLTQAALAERAAIPRLKIVQIEAGKPHVSVEAYARVAAALGAEFQATPAKRPTIDEIGDLLK